MIKKFQQSLVVSKIAYTLGIIFIYMLGRMIPLATTSFDFGVFNASNPAALAENLSAITGIQNGQLSLFSLGISPWIMTTILWRFLGLFTYFKEMTATTTYYYKILVTILLAGVQAFSLLGHQIYVGSNPELYRLFTFLILLAGVFVLVWLGDRNTEKGIGGITIIFVVNMLMGFGSSMYQYLTTNNFTLTDYLLVGTLFLSACVFLTFLAIILNSAEYRIPIRRINVDNEFGRESYLPIRVRPAGAQPMMYAMSFMVLPTYILDMLIVMFPANPYFKLLLEELTVSRPFGLFIYGLIIYLLSIAFSYYNYDTFEIAKGMRNSGDYIPGIQPGLPTRKYLQRILNLFTQFGAWISVAIGVGPTLFVVLQHRSAEDVGVATLLTSIYVIVSMILGMKDQVDTLQSWKKYKDIF